MSYSSFLDTKRFFPNEFQTSSRMSGLPPRGVQKNQVSKRHWRGVLLICRQSVKCKVSPAGPTRWLQQPPASLHFSLITSLGATVTGECHRTTPTLAPRKRSNWPLHCSSDSAASGRRGPFGCVGAEVRRKSENRVRSDGGCRCLIAQQIFFFLPVLCF